MNEVLKQRLVGALILLALGVVFWPIVFVEPEQESAIQQRSIPEAPVVSSAEIEAPSQADLRGSPPLSDSDYSQGAENNAIPDNVSFAGNEEAELAAAAAIDASASGSSPEPGATRSEPPKPLAVDADGVPVAWTLQVATVSSPEKAEALRARLLLKHEKAYVTTVSSGGRQLYRVCIGPKFEKRELEGMQAGINAEFGVNSMLVRYLP